MQIDIKKIISQKESEKLEFKAFFDNHVIESLVDFANACGGEERGLPRPKFEVKGNGFLVTLLNKKTTQKTAQKTSLKERIISVIAKEPRSTRSSIASVLGLSENTIKEYLVKLKKEGRIIRIGPDKGGYWKVVKK